MQDVMMVEDFDDTTQLLKVLFQDSSKGWNEIHFSSSLNECGN